MSSINTGRNKNEKIANQKRHLSKIFWIYSTRRPIVHPSSSKKLLQYLDDTPVTEFANRTETF